MTAAGALGATLVAALLRLPSWWRAPIVIALALALVLWANPPRPTRLERALSARWMPAVFALASSLAMWYAWGSLRQVPLRYDEAAYLLQADLFAGGRWTDPPPPMPQFFERPHVVVTPTLASVYPPGHSLILTPGVWLHAPGLIPVVLLGLTGGFIFALTRGVVRGEWGAWAGLLAWLGWIGLEGHRTWARPSYISEITTSALWLVGWWALLRWRAHRGVVWLCLLALCIAWGAITRPLTMLAYGIPVAVIVMRTIIQQRLWPQLGYAIAAGAVVLGLIPWRSARTTGDWRKTPVALYTSQYVPRGGPGLGSGSAGPTRPVPRSAGCFAQAFGVGPGRETILDAPADLAAHASALVGYVFADWRGGLLPFLLVGIAVMPIELACAVACCVLLVVAYLHYPTDPPHAAYLLDAQAGIIALAAFGLSVVLALIGRRWFVRRAEESANGAAARFVGWCTIAITLGAAAPTVDSLRGAREGRQVAASPQARFEALLDSLPASRSVVFVRSAPSDSACGEALVADHPPLATARVWVVRDLGDDNRALLHALPDRAAFLFDVGTWQIYPVDRPVPPARSLTQRRSPRTGGG